MERLAGKMITRIHIITISLCCIIGATLTVLAEPLILADMEGPTEYKLFGSGQKPTAQLTRATASSGQRSLRVEYTGGADDTASIVFPLSQSVEGLDTLVFDIFCEADNGATLVVTVHQKVPDPSNQAAYYKTRFLLGSFVDDWTTLRLPARSAMRFVEKGGFVPDWSLVDTISFTLSGGMHGKAAFYLDTIAADASGMDASPNLIYNSSFERATTGDVPDGWRRDFNQPPFGPDSWGLVTDNPHDGNYALRIGVPGKYAVAWGQFSQVIGGMDYVCSAWLRGAEGTKAQLYAAGIGQKEVEVTPEWQRYLLTGTARDDRTQMRVQLISGGPLFIDAAQLEPGTEATPYHPNPVDAPVATDEPPAEAPVQWQLSRQATMTRLTSIPVMDGKLDDSCWQATTPLSDFRKLETDEPADQRTDIRLGFTDSAIYIGIEAFDDDMAAVAAHLADHPRGPWGTDLIELFLDMGRTGTSYHQLVANTRGDLYSAWYSQPKRRGERSCHWQSVGALGDQSWTLEIMIPLAGLAVPDEQPPAELGLNVCRTNPRLDTHGSWVFMGGNFHRPERFGRVDGFKADWRNYQWSVSGLSMNGTTARCLLRNDTGADQELNLHFLAEAPGHRFTSTPVPVSVPAGQSLPVHQQLPIARDGSYQLTLIGVDQNDTLLISSQPSTVSVGGASLFRLLGTRYDLYTTEPAADVRVDLSATADQLQAAKLAWELLLGDQALANGSLPAVNGCNTWALPLADVPDGALRLRVELVIDGKSTSAGESRFRKAPAHDAIVRVDRWQGLLQVDGETFFPYGFFDETVSRNDLTRWPAVLADMAAIGCNTALVYAGNNPAVHQRLEAFLDEAQKHNVKLWVHLSGFFSWWIPRYNRQQQRYQDEDAAKAALAQVVSTLRDHPALLGWCTLDEPGNHPTLFTSERAHDYYEQVKSLDPYHPVIFSHLNQLGDYDTYGTATDMALIPFLARGGRYDQLFNEFSTAGLPVITNTPCYGAAGSRDREPTTGEQRSAIYKSLILGSSGLLTYLYRPASENLWQEFAQLGREAHLLAPILHTPNLNTSLDALPAGNDLLATLSTDGTQLYLVAVNVSPRPMQAVFTLLDHQVTAIEGLFAPTPQATLEGNQIRVSMEGQGTLALRLTPAAQ